MVGISETATEQKFIVKIADVYHVYTLSHVEYDISELNKELGQIIAKINKIVTLNYPPGASENTKAEIDNYNMQREYEREEWKKQREELTELINELTGS